MRKVPIPRFRASYESILSQLKAANTNVILLQQEVITPDVAPIWYQKDIELYRAAFSALAQKHKLPYISPKDWISGELETHFDEQEYYNIAMHQQLANAMMLFTDSAIP